MFFVFFFFLRMAKFIPQEAGKSVSNFMKAFFKTPCPKPKCLVSELDQQFGLQQGVLKNAYWISMTFVVDVVSCFSEDEPYSNDCGRPTDLWHQLFPIRHLMRIHMVVHCPPKMIPYDYGGYFDLCIVPVPVQIVHWILIQRLKVSP